MAPTTVTVAARARRGAMTSLLTLCAIFMINTVPVSTGLAPEHPSGVATAIELAANATAASTATTPATSSALTVSGTGDYADLAVTASQTRDLVNQSISVSWKWKGSDKHATLTGPGDNRANFMQIMQCWGDTTPDRTQCQFGSYTQSDTLSASRQIYPGSLTQLKNDPSFYLDDADASITADNTAYHSPGSPAESYYVPFRPVGGRDKGEDDVKGVDVAKNPYFSVANTNEIPYASTRADGTGFQTFETYTFQESNGLGCGDIIKAGAKKGKPRACWLVVVPRGQTEVDGRAYTTTKAVKLQSSPLSATNWKNRIVLPLGFAPVGQPCPIGAAQLPVGGVETATEAVLRWQPALCANGGAVYSYSQFGDAVAENSLVSDDPSTANALSFLNGPLAPSTVPADRTIVYAPVTLSGLSVSLLIERQPANGAPKAVKDRQSERITDVNLTPRLVAKLLTQSYRAGVDTQAATYLSGNPVNIDTDPDFVAVNPEFRQLNQASIQIVTPSVLSKNFDLLWRWIIADQDARDFVAGLPDPYGMEVNPFYQGIDLPQDGLPKVDPFCRRGPVNGFEAPPLCVFDLHPYAQDLHEVARLVSRGDPLARQWSNPSTDPLPIVSKKIDPPQPGGRQILGLTDTPTASRYALVTAKLRNASGRFVAPDTKGLLAGFAAMIPTGVPGVVTADPTTLSPNAYPLTALTYAATAPNQLSVDRAKGYAAFIRYAVGAGQKPGTAAGTLPDGYAPLPASLRAQSLKAATQVQARVGPKAQSTPPSDDDSGSGSSNGGGSNGGGSTGTPSATPAPTASAPPVVAAPVSIPATSKVVSQRTPGDARVATRYAFLVALTLGIAAAVLGPLMPRLAQRLVT